MFFALSKIIAFAFRPLTWVIILLILGLFHKKPKRKVLYYKSSLFLLLFFSNSFLAKECARIWEYESINPKGIERCYDVGIVLGGGIVSLENEDKIFFNKNTDRIMQALFLYKKGKIKKILIAGGPGSLVYRNIKEAALLRTYLAEIGFDKNDIITDTVSDNTRENAIYSAKLIHEKFPNGDYLLITSSIHARRAKACFDKVGLRVDVYPTNPYGFPRKWDFESIFTPSVGALVIWGSLLHEIIGYITYSLVGYI